MKLTSKIFITGEIVLQTGTHIGGSKSALDIGGVDLNVIKSPSGMPFLPGSSLKGKLRSLLARTEGSIAVNRRDLKREERGDTGITTDEDVPFILQIFGSSGDANDQKGEVTRLLVRDALLDDVHFKATFDAETLELSFSEIKWENRINRRTGTAQDPRQLERVPAGAKFNFEMVYDVYEGDNYERNLEKLLLGMRLLQDDYLGGHGSRGYGKISFENVQFSERSVEAFYAANASEGKVLENYQL